MPVLNEAGHLYASLSKLYLSENEELVVVDGGSSDNTLSIAGEFTDKVFTARTGRASVMNFGARKAEGDILLFLHADCILPEGSFDLIRSRLNDESVAAGGFNLIIDHKGFIYRIIENMSNLRCRLASLIYGDQGMFLKRALFERIGGFADIPLMEDIEISRRLKRTGRIIFLRPPIKASPRRWIKEGPFYTTLRDWTIAFSYTFIRVSPEKLIKYYREIR